MYKPSSMAQSILGPSIYIGVGSFLGGIVYDGFGGLKVGYGIVNFFFLISKG